MFEILSNLTTAFNATVQQNFTESNSNLDFSDVAISSENNVVLNELPVFHAAKFMATLVLGQQMQSIIGLIAERLNNCFGNLFFTIPNKMKKMFWNNPHRLEEILKMEAIDPKKPHLKYFSMQNDPAENLKICVQNKISKAVLQSSTWECVVAELESMHISLDRTAALVNDNMEKTIKGFQCYHDLKKSDIKAVKEVDQISTQRDKITCKKIKKQVNNHQSNHKKSAALQCKVTVCEVLESEDAASDSIANAFSEIDKSLEKCSKMRNAM